MWSIPPRSNWWPRAWTGPSIAAAKRRPSATCGSTSTSFLPRFALIDTARDNDARRAREICAGIRPGEIVLFDKAYVDFSHLWALVERGIFWVTRAKDNLVFDVIEKRPVKGAILRDEIVCLGRDQAFADYPGELRRIVARVEIDGREQEMVFLTNNREWSAQTIADLYRCRWTIEVFFKQIKQTLQLADFLGHSANAVRWQVWMALLVYVLLRFLAVVHGWHHSFTRLFTLLRAALWRRWDLPGLLRCYGTDPALLGSSPPRSNPVSREYRFSCGTARGLIHSRSHLKL
jgi:hypothetical protein